MGGHSCPHVRTGKTWITEAGAYRYRAGRARNAITNADQSADLATFFNSGTYHNNLQVITRFYYYEWHGDAQPVRATTNDTGLVQPDRTRRTIYCTFKAKSNPGTPC